MKKSILPLIIAVSVAALSAQTTEFDAVKMAQTDINGTARYMGMAGAFGALGGDVSSIKNNPAGLGVYRSSEITTTFNLLVQSSNSDWGGKKGYDDLSKFNFNNLSLVLSSSPWRNQNSGKGLLQSNWGFSYNRLKNFNRTAAVKGNAMSSSITDYYAGLTNDTRRPDLSFVTSDDFIYSDNIDEELFFADDRSYLSWPSIIANKTGLIHYNQAEDNWHSFLGGSDLSTPSYYLREKGYIDEYTLSWGGNISNIVFLGAAFNYSTIHYSKNMEYNETYSGLPALRTESHLRTAGDGISLNLGLIVRPFDQLRLGISYKTPTYYTLRDDLWDAHLDNFYAPDTYYDYELRTPGKFTASAACIIGKRAIISTDFTFVNYKNLKLYDYDGSSSYYEYENNTIKDNMNYGLTAQVGAEFRVTDRFSLRAGFAAETASMKSDMGLMSMTNTVRTDTDYFIHKGTNYFTAGLGYRGNYWYFDAAFVNKNLEQEFMPYNTTAFKPASVKTHNYDIVATVGLKF